MQGVAEQRDRAGGDDDDRLDGGGEHEGGERDGQHAHAATAGLQRGVRLAGGVVAVRGHGVGDPPQHRPDPPLSLMTVPMPMPMPVVVVVVVVVVLRRVGVPLVTHGIPR